MTDKAIEPELSTVQAYEAAYRFIARYYEREQIIPIFLMLQSMGWERTHDRTNDPASWPDWQEAVRETVEGEVLPELTAPQ